VHASRVVAGVAPGALALVALAACRAALPQPPGSPQPESAFAEVPYPPPAAHVETVPRKPSPEAVWIDGQWSWSAGEWSWSPGGWVEAPRGAGFAQWKVRLERDGTLQFAAPSWRDASGRELPAPRFLARAPGDTTGESSSERCP
jgi:hypothetical protein